MATVEQAVRKALYARRQRWLVQQFKRGFERYAAEFDESKHPRDSDGKFGGGGGGESSGQKRARKGGEYGPNGEWYKGGAYIATTDMPKKAKDKRNKAAARSVFVEPGKREVPEPGQLPIFSALDPMFNFRDGTLNEQAMAHYGWDSKRVERAEDLAKKYMDGERWVEVNDYPEFTTFGDLARMAKGEMPIPGEALKQMAIFRGVDQKELEEQLGVKKEST